MESCINQSKQMLKPVDHPLLSRQLELFLEQISEAVDVVDSNGRIIWVNRAFEELYGWEKTDLLGSELLIIPPDLRKELDSLHEMVQEGHRIIGYETLRKHADGTLIHIDLTVFPLTDHAGTIGGRVGISKDVTKQKVKNKYLATHDQLTKLPNRTAFLEVAQKSFDKCKGTKDKIGIAIINLDKFTFINHSFGQSCGDQLLKEVAFRLRKWCGRKNIIARLGNDEFIVLFNNMDNQNDLVECVNKMVKGFEMPFESKDGKSLTITASVGVSLSPRDGRNLELLIQKAYIALHAAKKAGGHTFLFYQSKLGKVCSENFLLGQDLRKVIQNDELEVHYQPMVEMSTGRICGLEALLRWKHPQKGFISPSKFIPIAEEIGMIDAIGLWILRKACLDIIKIQEWSHRDIKVAVNLSAYQLQDKNLPRQIQKILRETKVDGRFLELEITESAIIKNTENTIKNLHELRAMGIQISIDDFGTGYSSLDYLKRFPLDHVKIDKSFIQGMYDRDVVIVNGIIKIAQHLNLRVIGEGVESLEHLEFLRRHNCDLYQGYLISKPLPLENVGLLLRERQKMEYQINLDKP